jgi:hypothetical protein
MYYNQLFYIGGTATQEEEGFQFTVQDIYDKTLDIWQLTYLTLHCKNIKFRRHKSSILFCSLIKE